MNPRRAALAAALVTVLAVVGAVTALSVDRTKVLPETSSALLAAETAPAAPELAGISHFDNTEPLTLASLRGRVVLVDFWTYTCINCRRTFPFLRALQKTYTDLTIVGVHSPEFGFEKSHDNVARAVKELGVTWPVAEDPEMVTWRAWDNQYWPAKYLVDRTGKVRYFHAGEGDEAETEQAIRALLSEGGEVPTARASAVGDDPGSGRLTPETYLGSGRGIDPTLVFAGPHTVEPEYSELGAGASVQQAQRGRDVYATVELDGTRPVTLDITLDGQPVPAARRGPSLSVVDGRTVAVLASDDLLHLLTGTTIGDGTLTITARSPGARLFTFTFGG